MGPKLEPSGPSWAEIGTLLGEVESKWMLQPCRIETLHLDDV